jgi:quercetin dioxygenase-like cupin family protein
MTITQIEPKHSIVYDNTIIKIFHVNKSEGLSKHSHDYAHLTMCHAGSCIIRKENRELIMNCQTTPVNLVANEWHEIEALEDNTVFVNIFAEGKY